MSGSVRPRVFLHVGTPKTGTTYLQDLLWRNRQELRRRGVHYPGRHHDAHFLAAMDLQGATAEEVGVTSLPGAWARLVDQVTSARGTVVVSHELFSPMGSERVERALDALGGGELHVVCTVRDLGRQLPAVWQENLKNRHTLGFAEFLDSVRNPAKGHWLGELFWRMQDVPDVLRRWAGTLPPQRVHVVTVPPAGSAPRQLWQRFATVLAVRPDGLDDSPAEPNNSLGLAEAQLLRRLNLALSRDLPWEVYGLTVREQVVDVLARRSSDVRRVVLPPDQLPWVTEEAKRMVAALTEAEYQVVGDLNDLLPTAVPPGPDPDAVSDAELLDIALKAAGELVHRYGGRITQAQRTSLRRRARSMGLRPVWTSPRW
ncbi:MAG: hypothetical protein QOG46_966 [Pseudonocardiales bacterium]|jgi:hypothetical protein|nr:hypothetical protein [Pseudonocardiales bacterium]